MPFPLSRTAALAATSLISLSLLGIGCGPSIRPMVDTDTGTVNLQGENGGSFSAGENAQIPANFPADFPRYPGAKITLAYAESQGRASTLVQETSDSFEKAQANVKQALQAQGFAENNVLSSADLVILSYSKGNIKYQINIAHQENKTMIQAVRVETEQQP